MSETSVCMRPELCHAHVRQLQQTPSSCAHICSPGSAGVHMVQICIATGAVQGACARAESRQRLRAHRCTELAAALTSAHAHCAGACSATRALHMSLALAARRIAC